MNVNAYAAWNQKQQPYDDCADDKAPPANTADAPRVRKPLNLFRRLICHRENSSKSEGALFRWTKSYSVDLPEEDSVDRVALLLRLFVASAVVVFLFGIPMSDLVAIALDDSGIRIPGISYLGLVLMMLVALWGFFFLVFALFVLRRRRKPRQEGFDVLPPSKK